jgi:hypothetical protein
MRQARAVERCPSQRVRGRDVLDRRLVVGLRLSLAGFPARAGHDPGLCRGIHEGTAGAPVADRNLCQIVGCRYDAAH